VNSQSEKHKTVKNLKGLNKEQVEQSRKEHGANILTPAERDPWWKLLLEKFDDPIIRILMIAAFIAILVGTINGEYLEGIGIVIAILLATILAFLNEYKASKEFDILNKVSDEVQVRVIRNGNFTTIPRKDIVVGDLVMIEAGDEIPADGNLVESVSLQIDEARLTGESLPVAKFAKDEPGYKPDSGGAYGNDFLLRSTMLFDGHATFEVTAVGDHTEIGKAARAASEETDEETPLNLQLDDLGKLIGVVGFSVAFLTFGALVARGYGTGELNLSSSQWGFTLISFISAMILMSKVWLPIIADGFTLVGKKFRLPTVIEKSGLGSWLKILAAGFGFFFFCIITGTMSGYVPAEPASWITAEAISDLLKYFMIAVTIIVVAVPEGLPMSVTLSLAYSMRRMTAANNLVRRMHACETIGAATVICSDKTGTLTQNKMIMNSISFPALDGQNLDSELKTDITKIIAESMAVNSTANLNREKDSAVQALGNPTEGATLLWLHEQNLDYLSLRQNFNLTKQWTFSTERKMMGSYGTSALGEEEILYVKGAPELLVKRCSQVLTQKGLQPIEQNEKEILEGLKNAQKRGMRTLGFACKKDFAQAPDGELVDIANDMVWMGFAAIADPIRPDVPKAIEVCQKAGVEVKIVTGDNSNTAWEIAGQIGLIEHDDKPEEVHMTGSDFQALNDEQAFEAAKKIKILSRARPADKMKMVKLLQKADEIVAVTGDGTNDAPALNHANVGLSMGITGTSVAKEASDIILLDDSFPSVVKGIMWGRSLYENIQRFVMFQLTINVVALSVALTGPFIGIKMPLTVVQMLWVNLIMDTFAALALATEPPHWKVMGRPPRSKQQFIVTKPMYQHIFGVGAVFFAILIGLLKYYQADGVVTPYELSLFFTIFVMLQVWNMFNARALGFKQSALKGITRNKGFMVILPAIVVIQILIVQFGKTMFRTQPISLKDWIIIALTTSLVLWGGELFRLYRSAADKSVDLPDESPFS
jgi:Ca2+-transporting ATPase